MTSASPTGENQFTPDRTATGFGHALHGSNEDTITIVGGRRLARHVTVGPSVPAALALLAAAAAQSAPITVKSAPSCRDVENMILLIEAAGWSLEPTSSDAITVVPLEPCPDLVRAGGPPDLFYAGVRTESPHLISALLRAYGCAALPWPANTPRDQVESVLAVYKHFHDEVTTDTAGYAIAMCAEPAVQVQIAMTTRDTAPTVAAMLRACIGRTRIQVQHPSRAPEALAVFHALHALGWRGRFNDNDLDLAPTPAAGLAHEWTVPGDGFEAAACACAIAATGGRATVTGALPHETAALRNQLRSAGIEVERARGRITVARARRRPGVPIRGLRAQAGSDLHELSEGQLTLLLATAPFLTGKHELTDPHTTTRTRSLAANLSRLGTTIEVGAQGLVRLTGPQTLTAITRQLEAQDPTGTAALVIAALATEGTTVIGSAEQLDRAHPALLEHLRALGGQIRYGLQ